MQSQLSEEKEKVAHSTEQLQQEKSRKAQELMETRDAHQSQISGLQETIANLVSIVSQSQQCQCVKPQLWTLKRLILCLPNIEKKKSFT